MRLSDTVHEDTDGIAEIMQYSHRVRLDRRDFVLDKSAEFATYVWSQKSHLGEQNGVRVALAFLER